MIGIVDYGLGNLRSVAGAVERLGAEALVTSEPRQLASCEKLMLPGVGAFGDGMANLRRRGLIQALNDLVISDGKPILGICLGAQLMANESEEFGEHCGLGWFDARIIRLSSDDPSIRIPHVGWDDIELVRESPLFSGLTGEPLFYYVHSYCIAPATTDVVDGECTYGQRFAAALHRDNIFAVQFHPEKSQRQGIAVIANFLRH